MFKLLKSLRPREIIMAVICAVLVVGQVYLDLELPDYMTELTTLINTSGTTESIIEVGLKMLACTVLSAMLAIICGFLSSRTASGFSYTVREKLFYHVVDMGKAEMQAFSVPSLITRTTNDITQIQMIISMGLQMLIKAPIMAVWGIIKILGKSWELSIVTAGFVVALCCVVILVVSTCLPRFRKVQKMTDRINKVARENLTGINVVHAFNAEDYQNEKFNKASKDMYDLQLKNQRLFALISPTMTLGMSGLTLAIYWVGAVLVNNIALSDTVGRIAMFSEILAFGTYATYIVMSFMMLIIIFMMVPQAQVSAERINEVLEKDFSIVEGEVTDGIETGSVEFRNVSFSYPDSPDKTIIKDFSAEVHPGQKVAIVGPTGAGKTTMVNLLMRFFEINGGDIYIDGISINDLKRENVHEMFAMVLQDTWLFEGTVRENLVYNMEGIDDDEIEKVCEVCGLDKFIHALPHGLDTVLSESVTISAGQKQLLTIARAMLQNSPMLILDEATSSVDTRTEAIIQRAMDELTKDRTSFVIAHRLSTIKNADLILVMKDGDVIEKGDHESLMAYGGFYKELYNSQFEKVTA